MKINDCLKLGTHRYLIIISGLFQHLQFYLQKLKLNLSVGTYLIIIMWAPVLLLFCFLWDQVSPNNVDTLDTPVVPPMDLSETNNSYKI